LLFLIGVIVIQSTTAVDWPTSIAGRRADPGIIDDIIGWIKDAANITSDKLKEAIDRVIDEVEKFFKRAKEDGMGVLVEFAKIALNLREYASEAIDFIAGEIRDHLADIEDKVGEILDLVDIKFDDAMDLANHTLFDATMQLQNWKLAMVAEIVEASPPIEKQGLKIINDFVEKSLIEVYSCSHGAIQPIKDLYMKVKELIDDTLPLARGIVDKVEACAKDNGLNVKLIGKCIKEVKDEFIVEIKELPSKILRLKSEVVTAAIDELLNVPCIVETRLKVEVNKKLIKKQILALVASEKLLRILHGN